VAGIKKFKLFNFHPNLVHFFAKFSSLLVIGGP